MQKSFLELGLVRPKYRHPMMRDLLKFMNKELGKPCATFGPNCCICEAYLAFARLDNLFETSMVEKLKKIKPKK